MRFRSCGRTTLPVEASPPWAAAPPPLRSENDDGIEPLYELWPLLHALLMLQHLRCLRLRREGALERKLLGAAGDPRCHSRRIPGEANGLGCWWCWALQRCCCWGSWPSIPPGELRATLAASSIGGWKGRRALVTCQAAITSLHSAGAAPSCLSG